MQAIKAFTSWIRESRSLVLGHENVATSFPTGSLKSREADDSEYQGNPRLGFLYQELCRRLFDCSDHYRVLAEEIQLQHNGRTLGAIDFLIENQGSQQTEHWEVAIKFYLLKDGYWYGPNARDRLDKKLKRMLDHQLTMSETEAFQQRFPELPAVSQHLLMQGRLYTNPFDKEPIPDTCLTLPINQERVCGYWCYQSQFHRLTEPVYPLTKPLWAIGHMEQRSKAVRPVTVLPSHFIHCQSESGQFWFIVPDDWPQGNM
ncbi:DUF1853 family protein [Vibrio hangzhouensis]|uniref:DUF1853 family protein n=1 Tax=Vibrio hangzhouensis TaxID=462991 RepID=UPI001C952313|nr:DUF1853 family protein [Vibrio hangzhouensis]MBY6197590.1 DUF1853 family protein [Vibrio hangzhouensis]